MFQRRRCCVFDSPGLPNDSAGYPGLTYDLRGTTASVLRFLSVIRYKSPRYTHVFTEKAQHLRRWISLRSFTRGRLAPRQPRAIKNTTRTELRDKTIVVSMLLLIKCKMICVISLCKIRQITRPFDADHKAKWRRWRGLLCHFAFSFAFTHVTTWFSIWYRIKDSAPELNVLLTDNDFLSVVNDCFIERDLTAFIDLEM